MKRKKIQLLGIFLLVVTVVLVGVVNFTDACRLEEVQYNGTPLDNWAQRFDMLKNQSLFRQPLDKVAERLLAEKDVYKVDLSVALPHTLEIRTNAFSPLCFLVDKKTGVLYGVDDMGRVVPLEHRVTDWERPVFTGVSYGNMFDYCPEFRVALVTRQLKQLAHDNPTLFRLIEEIHLSSPAYVLVTISGLPLKLKLSAERFSAQLEKFTEFITKYDVDLSEVRGLDLRFEDMIICSRGKR